MYAKEYPGRSIEGYTLQEALTPYPQSKYSQERQQETDTRMEEKKATGKPRIKYSEGRFKCGEGEKDRIKQERMKILPWGKPAGRKQIVG